MGTESEVIRAIFVSRVVEICFTRRDEGVVSPGQKVAIEPFWAVGSAIDPTHQRGCHSPDTPSPSLLKRLLKGEGGAAE